MSFRAIERKREQFQKMKVNEPLNSCNSMRLMTCYVGGAVQGSIEYPFMALWSLQLMKIIRCKGNHGIIVRKIARNPKHVICINVTTKTYTCILYLSEKNI